MTSARVLVVDDDPVAVRDVLEALDERDDLECRGASSLVDARQAALDALPDLVIIGLRPHDAQVLIAELRAQDPTIEALVMTSPHDAEATARALATVGPLAHVAKPAEVDELLPRVGAALEHRALVRQVAELQGALATRDQALAASRHQAERAAAELRSTSTELATATERLVRAEQLAAVGRVVGGIAHELSRQLALVGYAEAIKSRLGGDPELVELADVIISAQKRLAAMVDEIRDFAEAPDDARARPGLHREPADLAAVVDDALALLAYDRDVRRRPITWKWHARPLVALHRDKFSQVVINLVHNAVLATAAGSPLVLEIAVEGGRAVLTVADHGVGMPPEVLARLGEPFFTTRGDRGSGLGVGICKRIVEEHGGALTFTSTVGVGTTARVELPVLDSSDGGKVNR